MAAEPAITASGLTKRFGDLVAVAGIDFEIVSGECFGFLGPNGAGKTTTMRMLSCLALRDAGTLRVVGEDPHEHPRRVKARLGVVAQELNLDMELTVRENLLTYARYFDVPRGLAKARVAELLEFARLTDRSEWTVDRLSGGMQRRVQIARALVNEPQVLLLDEPTTGLDPQARHLVWDRLRDLKRRGVTLVLTTHYMDEAEQLCDRLVVMDHGRIVRQGTPAQLIADEVGGEVLEVVATIPVGRLLSGCEELVHQHRQRDHTLLIYTRDADAIVKVISRNDPGCALRAIRRATLEDVFLQVTGHELREQ